MDRVMLARRELLAGLALCASAARAGSFDTLILGGLLVNGTGAPARRADVAIAGGRIAAIGDLGRHAAAQRIDAGGLAVAPGFINMLSWANDSLLTDGRAMSDVFQGITTEIMGEGWSNGPYNDRMKADGGTYLIKNRNPVRWTTLGEYLDHVVAAGVSVNVASFVGAMTVRVHELGYEDVPANPAQLTAMAALVSAAMREGALGVGASLIYPPNSFASTEELTVLAAAAAKQGGGYIAHIRSEGDQLLEAIAETIAIARAAGTRAEIYHLKAAGRSNWPKMTEAIAAIETARADNMALTANIYPYTAGQTSLAACLPPAIQTGADWHRRLGDPAFRSAVEQAMMAPGKGWENLFLAATPDGIIPLDLPGRAAGAPLRPVSALAADTGRSPAATVIDLVHRHGPTLYAAYELMGEANVDLGMRQPWVSFGTDEPALAADGVLAEGACHPRAYGTFPRAIRRLLTAPDPVPLEEIVRRMTSLPADNLRLRDRGRIVPGQAADIVIFDARRIADLATFDNPHRYSIGVVHVLVNGIPVVAQGRHTGARAGRVVRGPGWAGWP